MTQTIKFNGRELRFDPRDATDLSVLREIFKFREYRSAESEIIKAVNPIVDAGAHAGFFSVYCRVLNPNVKIIALEPEAENIKVMKNNLRVNKVDNVEIVPLALAGESGKRELEISADSHNHRLIQKFSSRSNVKGSLDFARDDKTQLVVAYSFTNLCDKYKISKISLLKMDIEGAEEEVLASMNDKDFKKIKAIIFEYHRGVENTKMMEKILRENKFGVQIFPSQFDKKMGFVFGKRKNDGNSP